MPRPQKSTTAMTLAALVTLGVASRVSAEKPPFRADAVLKDYGGDTLIAINAPGHGDNGVLTGDNVELLRSKIVEHARCAQATVYAAWPHAGGMWPADPPATAESIEFVPETLNRIVDWARSEDLVVAHHLLIGPNFYMPDWFATAEYTPDQLDVLLREFVRSTLGSNGNGEKVAYWNLVNEVLKTDNSGEYQEDGAGRWDCRWAAMGDEPDRSGLIGADRVNATHPVFIRKIFEYADEYTDGKLELRDYNIEFLTASVTGDDGARVVEPNRKAQAFYQLARHLVNSGVPIDAVGLQMHLNYGSDNHYRAYEYGEITENIRRLKELGLEVYVTELDVGLHWNECDEVDGVRVPNDKADWEAFEKEQPWTYYRAIKASREAGVDMISTWGLVDGTMENWRKGQKALLLDERGERKRAYQAVLRALYDTLPE